VHRSAFPLEAGDGPPREFTQMEPARLLRGEPATRVGRAIDLVAQLAAGDPNPVDDPDRMQALLLALDPYQSCLLRRWLLFCGWLPLNSCGLRLRDGFYKLFNTSINSRSRP
jgi:hypothetical protein